MAASRIIWHPVASHAAGTVSHTSAESDDDRGATVSTRKDAGEEEYAPRSATAPISRVICCFA